MDRSGTVINSFFHVHFQLQDTQRGFSGSGTYAVGQRMNLMSGRCCRELVARGITTILSFSVQMEGIFRLKGIRLTSLQMHQLIGWTSSRSKSNRFF